MVNVVEASVADVDATFLMVEPIANIGPQEEELIRQIKASRAPAILVINKIDTVEKEQLLEVIALYSQAHEFHAIIPIRAKNGEGVDLLLQEAENGYVPVEDFERDVQAILDGLAKAIDKLNTIIH